MDTRRPTSAPPPSDAAPWNARARVAWTVLSFVVVESLVLGVAVLPVAWLIEWVSPRLPHATWLRLVTFAVGLLPTYLLLAASLVVCTAAAARVLRWRSPANASMPVREYGWPLMDWARGTMLIHVVRVLVGGPLRASPFWTLFMRLNGARIGHRVWINSANIVDHNLLEFGDDVVVGAGVHLSGHTVERGVVKTGTVRVGSRVTIGVGTVVSVGTEIEDDAHVGALSFIPKWTRLAGGTTWVGAPVHPLERER